MVLNPVVPPPVSIGFFQIEAADAAEIEVVTAEGRTFHTRLPLSEPSAEFASVGTTECCATNDAQTDLAAKGGNSTLAIMDQRR